MGTRNGREYLFVGFLLTFFLMGGVAKAQDFFRETISYVVPGSRNYLGDVIRKPQARFFTEKNLQGDHENFNTLGAVNPRCHDLVYLSGLVKSVDTLGTCIRVYSRPSCSGDSLALYPYYDIKSSNPNRKYYFQIQLPQEVTSVGPCFKNELDESTFSINVKTNIKEFQKEKLRTNPDLLFVPDFFRLESPKELKTPAKEFRRSSGPIRKYRPKSFTKGQYISALVKYKDILKGRKIAEKLEKEKEDLSQEDDADDSAADDDNEDENGHKKVKNGYILAPFLTSTLGVKQEEDSLPFSNKVYMLPYIRQFLDDSENRIARYLQKNQDDTVRVQINGHYTPPGSGIPGRLLYLLYRIESEDRRSNFHSTVLLSNVEKIVVQPEPVIGVPLRPSSSSGLQIRIRQAPKIRHELQDDPEEQVFDYVFD